ncbi:MAG TPA: DAK2 domain-containing protein [Anaerolineales bacterium]|nr:DAK2 domain-containing protein [Anaerolineales bacterium]
MSTKSVNLVNLFETVAQSLAENQETLDQADRYNHDHGANMVQTFQTIASALEKKQDSSDSVALAYAAKQVAKKTDSGSSRLYAEHLNQAASQFKRKKVDEKGALQLLQTLIGGSKPSPADSQPAGSDLLGALMGVMAGGSDSSQGSSAPDAGDLLGALMGGMAGGSDSSQGSSAPDAGDLLGALMGGTSVGGSTSGGQQQGLNLQNILAAGMAYMQAKQSGKDTLQALIQAFVAGSNMGKDPYRTQSTELVVQSFLQALSSQAR